MSESGVVLNEKPAENSEVKQDALVHELRGLGNSETRLFEVKLGRLIRDRTPDAAERERLKGLLTNIAKCTAADSDVRYAAMYGLCLLARRSHNLQDFKSVLQLQPDEARASYKHLQAMYHMECRRGRDELRVAFNLAREALDANARHFGLMHHFAEIVATMVEAGFDQKDFELSDEIDWEKEKERARRYAKKIAAEEEYAKFQATWARWLVLEKDFGRAEDAVRTAIRLEPEGWDRPYRYADYRSILAGIAFGKARLDAEQAAANAKRAQDAVNTALDETNSKIQTVNTLHRDMLKTISNEKNSLDDKIRSATDKLQELRGEIESLGKDIEEKAAGDRQRQAEMLGFFAGILALILTVAQPDASKPMAAVTALLALAGVLLASYAALTWLMGRDVKLVWNVVYISAGLLVAGLTIPVLAYVFDWKGVMEMYGSQPIPQQTAPANPGAGPATTGRATEVPRP